MKKTYIVLGIIVVAVLFFAFLHKTKKETTPAQTSQSQTSFDAKNSTFTINSVPLTLVDGVVETPTLPDSTSVSVTRYFGDESTGDLNGDGLADTAFIVTHDSGGSGLFYYVVVALQTPTGYKTTNAFLVGDRITPQSTEIHADSRELRVNYADRKKGEPMTAVPSVPAVLLLKVTSTGVLEGLMK